MTIASEPFTTPISRQIWESRYRWLEDRREKTILDSWRRVARTIAAIETRDNDLWEKRFYELLEGFKFLPGGRILAGAGTGHRVTLFNCFVMGVIDDSIDGIFEALREGAVTMHEGGGVGYDFSTLRPKGATARASASIASGPVSFMRVWDTMCATVVSTGARRGAMMATLRCDHPDIEAFIEAKQDPDELRNFNVSVLVSDAFMEAVRADGEWQLVFPGAALGSDAERAAGNVLREWPGYEGKVPCTVFRTVRARELWNKLMRATYDYAEPGVLFVDRINRENNLWYCERISATNPCGEIPLPPYGACNLGSMNLTQYIREPFTPRAYLDVNALAESVAVAVRFLDNVVDASRFPLPAQARMAKATRRIGLGVTGLADALIMLGQRYGAPDSLETAATAMRTVCHAAYQASIEIAQEKGSFPNLRTEKYLASPFVAALPESIREEIRHHGIRNSHLTAIAPTGTISLLANNVSSGLEPVFDFRYSRRVREPNGGETVYELTDYAWRLWQERDGGAELPDYFVDVSALTPEEHLRMQAAIQPYVDNAISKTINVPADASFEQFVSIYEQAYDLGLKGCTTFRPNPITGAVLEGGAAPPAAHCCTPERETD